MEDQISGSFWSRFLTAISGHSHTWQPMPETEEEFDLGLGMEPMIKVQLCCAQCGKYATKTIHPMYGTVIDPVVGSPATQLSVKLTETIEFAHEGDLLGVAKIAR